MPKGDRGLAVQGRDGSGGGAGRPFSVWTAIAGALVGAIVVGAFWGVTSVSGASNPTEATVNGQAITHSALSASLFREYGQNTLETLIDDDIVHAAAQAEHVTASPTAVEAAEESIEAQYDITSPTDLAEFLASNNMTNAQFQSLLKSEVLEQQLAENTVTVTNAEIAAYYKAHKSTFTTTTPATKGKKATKTVQPLSQVKSEIVTDIKESKAPAAQALLASLAKKYHLAIVDPTYKALKAAIEDPTPTAG